MSDSALVRNERRKLAASSLNAVASATLVGGWLPPVGLIALGNAQPGAGPFLLMAFAIALSGFIFSMASRVLGGLEDNG